MLILTGWTGSSRWRPAPPPPAPAPWRSRWRRSASHAHSAGRRGTALLASPASGRGDHRAGRRNAAGRAPGDRRRTGTMRRSPPAVLADPKLSTSTPWRQVMSARQRPGSAARRWPGAAPSMCMRRPVVCASRANSAISSRPIDDPGVGSLGQRGWRTSAPRRRSRLRKESPGAMRAMFPQGVERRAAVHAHRRRLRTPRSGPPRARSTTPCAGAHTVTGQRRPPPLRPDEADGDEALEQTEKHPRRRRPRRSPSPYAAPRPLVDVGHRLQQRRCIPPEPPLTSLLIAPRAKFVSSLRTPHENINGRRSI